MKENYNRYHLGLLNEYRKDMVPVYLDIARSIRGAVEELVKIKDLVTSKRNSGNMLIKMGIACLAFPEPIVSNIVGGSLVALGYCIKRAKKGCYLEGAFEALRELRRFLTIDVQQLA
ncbi:MAG: hypothetical protein QW701_02725 [Candidatus Nezhaarchaeales archaeon]